MDNHNPAAINAATNKGNLTETEKAKYWELFINRTDVYAAQQADGRYQKHDNSITPEILFGSSTVASYQLNENDEIKWVCFDIDIDKKIYSKSDFKLDEWLPKLQEQTIAIRSELTKMGIPSYVEFSGKKGYHIWVFLDQLVKASVVKQYFERELSYRKLYTEINIEFFPKQGSTNGGYGNFVKPPLQMHQFTGLFSFFVDEEFNAIDGLPQIETYTLTRQHEAPMAVHEIIKPASIPISNDDGPKLNLSSCKEDEIKYLPSAVEFLSSKIEDRHTWIRCGLAIASNLGEAGREYFRILSDNPKYPDDTPQQVDAQYNHLLKSKRDKVNLSTIFYVAQQYKYEYPKIEPNTYENVLEMFNQDDERDPNKLLGFPLTKFKVLSENIDGVQPGFYLLGAESNVGKTAVLTNLCLDALETNPTLQVMYFSLDLPPKKRSNY